MASPYAVLSEHITLEFVQENLARRPEDLYLGDVLGSEAIEDERVLAANERSIAWASGLDGLDARQERRARAGRYLWLTAGAMLRECSPDDLELFACGILWAILIDDIVDEQHLNLQTDDLRASLSVFSGVLGDPDAPVPNGLHFGGSFPPLVEMARLLGRRLRAHPRGRAVSRGFTDWTDAIVLECCDSLDHAKLDLPSYMQIRSHTIAMLFVAELLFCANGYDFATHFDPEPIVRQLYLLGAQSVAYLNDIVSLPKELSSGGKVVNNAVTIEYDALLESGMEASAAARLSLERSVRRFNSSRAAIDRYARWLPAGVDPRLPAALQDMVRSSVDWHLRVSQRYLAAVK